MHEHIFNHQHHERTNPMNTAASYLNWTPKTYEEAWQTIKRVEEVSTQTAMDFAQDRFPHLFQIFLETRPRGKA